ncbi:MAG TPA: hypothetical protein PK191_04740 [Niabella sp.]|nr:hypothetical protein [Niabella sp.]HOZ95893.1 hypothetical protein [Niabella sp.]HQW15805.1 hypothetical protein [Niabella sp.]HQX20945.1 hypothetical protein [Niabella sp.]HQX41412.1 hypothetical protein [Niabella sp.]
MKNTKARFVLLVFAVAIQLVVHGQIQELSASKTVWITIGQLKWLANTKASLKYASNGKDTVYLMQLQDDTKLKDSRDRVVTKSFGISFKEAGQTLNQLYNMLQAFFEDANKRNKNYERSFRLGNDLVLVRHYMFIPTHTIIFVSKDSHIIFSEREIRKLFGR